jgi:cytochrome P450
MVIKEAMRLYPPVYSLNGRVANEDVLLGDYLIPKDSYVLISQWALHRNAHYFENPLQFDPERFSPENEPSIPRHAYLPFGAGPRVCIGNSFAMMEAHLILATVAQRFRLTLPADTAVTLNPQITLSVKDGLPMRVLARAATKLQRLREDKGTV